MQPQSAFLCIAGLLATLPSAWAATGPTQTHTVWQSGMASIPAGHSFAGSFDIGLFYDPATESLTDASLTLAFVGADQRSATPREALTVHKTDGTKDTYTVYDDPLDSVRVALGTHGGQTAQASDAHSLGTWTSAATSSTPVYGNYQDCHGLFIVTCSWVSYVMGHDRTFDRVEGHRGAFAYSGALDTSSLAALGASSVLHYGYTVDTGGAALASAMLSFTTAPVPEPATASLGLAGIAVMAAWLRRRRAPGIPADPGAVLSTPGVDLERTVCA